MQSLARANANNAVRKQRERRKSEKSAAPIVKEPLKFSLSKRAGEMTLLYNKNLDPDRWPKNPLIQGYIKIAQAFAILTSSNWFNNLIIGCIIMAGIIVGIQTYSESITVIQGLDTTILYIFTCECAFKILAEGMAPWRYFVGPEFAWNNFDAFIVIFCYLPLNTNASAARLLRLVRLMRVAKIVRKVPQLQMIIMGLVGGMKSIVYIMILLLLVFYLYAIAGFIFFKANDPWHYGNLGRAMVTLFRCSTMEDWTEIMYVNIFGCDVYPYIYVPANTTSLSGTLMDEHWFCTEPSGNGAISTIFHVSFIVLSALVMMSLFVGAVTMAMTESMDAMKEEGEALQRAKRLEKGKRMAEQMKAQQAAEAEAAAALAAAVGEGGGGEAAAAGGGGEGEDGSGISENLPKAGDHKTTHQTQRHSSSRPSQHHGHGKKAREQRRLQHLMMKAWGGMEMEEDDDEVQYSSPLKAHYAKVAKLARQLTTNPAFVNFVTLVIILAGVLVGLQTSDNWTAKDLYILNLLDRIIVTIFTFEVGMKIIAEEFEPWQYFTDGWNNFDFLIVAASYMSGDQEIFTLFRLLRLLRVLKLVKALPQLQVIVTALMMGLNSIGFIAIIMVIFFYFFAIIGMILFIDNDPWHFGYLHITMFTLFRCATLEDWTDVMYINMYGCDQYGYDEWPELCTNPKENRALSVAYFFTFTIIGALVLLSLFIGVVTTSMEEATEDMKEAKAVDRKVEVLQEKYQLNDLCVSMYREVFKLFDLDGGGTIEEEELAVGLASIGKRPPDAELADLIKQVDADGSGEIDFSEFLEFMALSRLKNRPVEEVKKKRRKFSVEGVANSIGNTVRRKMSVGSIAEKSLPGKIPSFLRSRDNSEAQQSLKSPATQKGLASLMGDSGVKIVPVLENGLDEQSDGFDKKTGQGGNGNDAASMDKPEQSPRQTAGQTSKERPDSSS